MIKHPIPPIYDENSTILILGSFPSVKSREEGFFYGHPQNRFWKLMALIFEDELPQTLTSYSPCFRKEVGAHGIEERGVYRIDEKKAFLLRNHIALWDVIGSCDIDGSADSSIRNVSVNDLSVILDHADIKQIYVNGKTAHRYYQKYSEADTGRLAVCLPSTSPANAAWSVERLIAAWSRIR